MVLFRKRRWQNLCQSCTSAKPATPSSLLHPSPCCCACVTDRYTIVVSTSTTVVPLQDNVPFRDVVAQGVYEFFRFDNPSSGSALSVTLTVFSGDGDLGVSLSVS
jgi:hypothetical protein